ncbi:MAG: multiheme c-type cytochrome, partial [Ferruginibacter sp.]
MYHKKSSLLIIILIAVVVCLIRCMNEVKAVDSRGRNFAGAVSCRQCHQAIYDSFISSAHYSSTSPAMKENIFGNFSAGHNKFKFNDTLTVVMEDRDSGYYQVLYEKGKEKNAYKFDIIFGCRNAQTSLYWQDNQTYELPVSFYDAEKVWATSPGFSETHPDFKRFIGTDCFECHSSNIKSLLNASTSGITQEMEKGSLIYGIDCERCHGPAKAHVLYHLENERDTVSKYLLLNGSLNRQQKIDGCALCHSGNDKLKIESRFRFRPGDSLDNYFMPKDTGSKVSDFDVHGNQYGLLKESKCFKNTST